MTPPARPRPVHPDSQNAADVRNALRRLIELLLGLLLEDLPAYHAQLTIHPDQAPYAELGNSDQSDQPDQPGTRARSSATLTSGGTVTLAVHGTLRDDDTTQATLRRFLQPMLACVELQDRVNERAEQARDAVAESEQRAITDLATGILMARRNCDAATARDLLAGWSARTGFDLQTLSAGRILELLTNDELLTDDQS